MPGASCGRAGPARPPPSPPRARDLGRLLAAQELRLELGLDQDVTQAIGIAIPAGTDIGEGDLGDLTDHDAAVLDLEPMSSPCTDSLK